MDKASFWKLVADVKWTSGENNSVKRKCDEVKRYILETYNAEQMTNFMESYRAIKNELMVVVDEHHPSTKSGFHVSDDGYDDLLSTIVSFGEAVYNDYKANPRKVVELGNSGNYHENFGYCLPYESDYQYCNLDYHKNCAKEFQHSYNTIDKGEIPHKYIELYEKVGTILDSIILSNKDSIGAIIQEYTDTFGDYSHELFSKEFWVHTYWLPNIISDITKYIL